MNITCRSMCYLSVCLSSFVAIYCPYSYLRPNDGHHFSVICQSVCYNLWPSVVHILTFVHMMDITCLSSPVCHHLWPFVVRIRTCVPMMDITCLSSVDLFVIISGHLLSVSVPASPQWTSLVSPCFICQSVIICGHLLSVSVPASPRWAIAFCSCCLFCGPPLSISPAKQKTTLDLMAVALSL